MKRKILSGLAITAMLTAMLGASGLVYADSHADATATADSQGAGTWVFACHDAYAEASAKTETQSSANVDEGYTYTGTNASYAYAEATSKNGGNAHADVSVYVGDMPYEGEIYGYAVSNAEGSGSHATSNVDIHYVIPAGAWVDIDANSDAYAIALLLSDGSTVWGFALTDARNGESALANVQSGKGMLVEAIIGADLET
ncbi:hypothetical protein ABFB09_07520 [Dehalogenimonas sp. THU2]|uniref:hypothetical protein n=1 Tax=Dehalogenimonas sp. THU2 TaxID=3151121 RepID=UPI003218CF52